jgi:hypothetical protein
MMMPTKLVEDQEGEERAHSRRGQSRENGQRVDEALVEDAQDEIDHEDGGEEQHAQALDRGLESLRRALERGGEGGGHLELALEPADLLHRVAQRYPGLEIE